MNRCLGCMNTNKTETTVCPQCGYAAGTGALEPSHLAPGTLLRGRYLVGRVLGYGGFGVTYIGFDTSLERKLAIKEYLPGELATRFPGQTHVSVFDGERRIQFEAGLERFIQEAQNLAQFAGQEGVVHIYDSFAEGHTAYIVMEYLQGQTLKQHLAAKGGKLATDEAIQLILPVLNALKKVHATGIIHRDISPDNIFLTDDGAIKLIDFGAARFASTQHSKSLSVILKPGYAPEEQYRSRGRQGPWTDIYAVGATFYRLITGQIPEEALERAVNDTLKAPSALGIKIGTGVENALMNALNVHAEDRIQQAAEFEAALLGTVKLDRKIVRQTRPDTGRWPAWLKWGTAAAAMLLIAVAALVLTGVIPLLPADKIRLEARTSQQPIVPGLVNQIVQSGQTTAEQSGLSLLIVDKQNSHKVLRDKIMAQTPAEGRRVEAGTRIEVVVSAGPELVIVPAVANRMAGVAQTMLEERGLIVVQEEVFSTDEAPGVVITQSIEAGTQLEKGKTVKLIVSKGLEKAQEKEPVVVPDLTGLTFDEARQKLISIGLYTLRGEDAYDTTIPKDQVMAQDVAIGETIQTGDTVTLIISLGIEQTVVPDVQYKSLDEAIELLQTAKLMYRLSYEESDVVKTGNIIRQDTAANQALDINTVITLVVSGIAATPTPVTTTAATTAATSAPEQTIKSNVPEGYLVDNLSSIFDNYRGIYNIEKTSLPFLSESGASKIVRDAGFTPVIKYDYHEIIPAGYMMTFGVWPEDELYAEGKYYRKEGADIELTISQGSPPPASSQPEGYVPDIMLTDVFSSYRLDYSIDQASLPFLSETQAQSIITSHKFQPYSETLYHDIIPAGHVANIGYYAEDEMVVDDIRYRKEGAKIVLYVSMGKLPSEYISFRLTRSLVGVSYEEAIAIMDSNHITYRTESGYTDLSGRKVTAVHYHELTEIVFTRSYSALYADDRALVKDSGTLILVFD